jgi:DNA-binding LacI/PurR family transcriptional regulator
LARTHVRYDDHAIGRLAADHFLERGFRPFVFYGTNYDYWYSTERRETFAARLAESGHSCTMFRRRSLEEIDWPEQLADCVQMLRNHPHPLAVWASSDTEASQVLEACREAKLSVPEEVAVLGTENDLMIAPFTTPPLSSVASNLEDMGFHHCDQALPNSATLLHFAEERAKNGLPGNFCDSLRSPSPHRTRRGTSAGDRAAAHHSFRPLYAIGDSLRALSLPHWSSV